MHATLAAWSKRDATDRVGVKKARAVQWTEVGKRVFAYCHDSVGIGHLRCTLNICEAVGRSHPGTSFLIATGTPYVQLLNGHAHVDFIKLPALTKNGEGAYCAKFLGLSVDEVMRCRESMLVQAVQHFAPDVMLVDKAPVGVCRELIPTLQWVRERAPHVRTVFGMRDIEDDPPGVMEKWTRDGVHEALERLYDEVWVYGMREVYDATTEYGLAPGVQRKARYTGYLCRPMCTHPLRVLDDRREVLVTVGGGTDGAPVLDAYLGAAAGRSRRWADIRRW